MAKVKQPCGCTVVYGNTFMEIDYCPRHAAAPELYEALENCQIMLQDYNSADRLVNRVSEQGGSIDMPVPKPTQLLILVGEALALADGD